MFVEIISKVDRNKRKEKKKEGWVRLGDNQERWEERERKKEKQQNM